MSKRSRVFECNTNPSNFCYMCGEYVCGKNKRYFSPKLRDSFEESFNLKVSNIDERWTPSALCPRCYVQLSDSRRQPRIIMPMLWRAPLCHATDCYFCLSKKTGVGKNIRWTYAAVSTVNFPVPFSKEPVDPQPPVSRWASNNEAIHPSSDPETVGTTSECESTYTLHGGQRLCSQAELNDWVRELKLSKEDAELHASRMKQFGFLAPGVVTTIYRKRHEPYARYYTKKDNICFCKDIPGLFGELGYSYDPGEWRLFIDSNKQSLKAILLHNGNKKPSIPIAHAVDTKETYEVMDNLLKCLNYEKHDWKVCADLKVIGILCGLQGGFTKYCCFLCLWDSRDRQHHYTRRSWTERVNFIPGSDNVKYTPLIKKENVFLPPLHIKLGLIKNFVKAINKDGEAFAYLKAIFPHLSSAKIKEGVFDGPQIKKLLQDQQFEHILSPNEAAAWNSFRQIVSGFLGNNKSSNYREIVEQLLQNYKKIGANMSLKIHFLHSHLDFFPDNLGDVSDEHDFNIQDEASIPEDIIDQQHLQEIIDKQQGVLKKADRTGNSASNDDGDLIDINLPYDSSEAEVDIILESQRSSEGSDDNKTNNNNQNTGDNNQSEVALADDGDKVVKDNFRKTNKKKENLEEKKTLKVNNKANNNGNIDNKNKKQNKIKSENNIDYSNQYMYDVEEQDLEKGNNDDGKFEMNGLNDTEADADADADDDDADDDDDGSAEYEKFKTMHEQKQLERQQQQQQQKEHMSSSQKRLNERKFNNNPDLNEKIVNSYNNNKNNHDNDGDNSQNGNADSYAYDNDNKNDDYEKFHKQQQQQQQPKEDAIGDIEENENQIISKTSTTNYNNNSNNDHESKDVTRIFIPRKMKRHNGAARPDDITNRHTTLRQQQEMQQQESQIDNYDEENVQKEKVAKISSQEENFKKKYYDILKENSTQDHSHYRQSAGEMRTNPKDLSYYDEHNDRATIHEVQKQTAFEKEKMLRRNNKRYGHKTHKKKYKDYLRYSQIMMMTTTPTTTTTTEQLTSVNSEKTNKAKDETTDKLVDRNGDLNALRDKHLAKLKLEKLKSLIPQAPIFFLKPKTEQKEVKEEPRVVESTAKPFYEGQINYFMETDDDEDSERANAVRFITKGERVDSNDWYKKLSPVLRNGHKKSSTAPEERRGFAAVRAGYMPYHHYKQMGQQSQSHNQHHQTRNHQYHHQQHYPQHNHHHQPHHRQVGKHSRHHAYQRKMMPRKSVATTTPLPPPSRQHVESGDAIRQLGHQITDLKDFERYYAKWPHLAKVQSQLHEEQLREEQSENYPDYEYDNDDYWEDSGNKDDNIPPYIRKYNRRNKQLLDLLEGTIAPPTKPVQQLRWSGSKLQPGPRDSSVGSMAVRIDDDYLKEKRKRYHQRQRQIHDLFAQQRQTTSTQTPPPTPPLATSLPALADKSADANEVGGNFKASQNSHTENHFPDEDVSISLETNEHDTDYNNPKQQHGNNNDDNASDDVSKSANEQQHLEIWQKEIDTKLANTGNSQLTWQMGKLTKSTPATPLGVLAAATQSTAQKPAIFKLPSYPSIAGSFMNRPRSRSAQFAPSSGSEFRRVTLPYLNGNLENNQNNMNNNFINAGGFVAYNGAGTNSKSITARFSQNTPNEYKQQQQQLHEAPVVLETQTAQNRGSPAASSEKSLYNRNNQPITPPSSSVTNSFVYHRVVDASPRLVGAGILAAGGRKQRLPFVAITDRRLETSKKSLPDHQIDFEQNHYPLP